MLEKYGTLVNYSVLQLPSLEYSKSLVFLLN